MPPRSPRPRALSAGLQAYHTGLSVQRAVLHATPAVMPVVGLCAYSTLTVVQAL